MKLNTVIFNIRSKKRKEKKMIDQSLFSSLPKLQIKPSESNKKVLSNTFLLAKCLLYPFRPNRNQLKSGNERTLPAVSIRVILVFFLPSTMKTGLKADAVIQSDQDCATRTQQEKKNM